MTSLLYPHKTTLLESLAEDVFQRSTGKPLEGLPLDGAYHRSTEALSSCLVGNLASVWPDAPPGQQRPHSLGLSFLVMPADDGTIRFSVDGRFDINIRSLPTLDDQVADLLHDGSTVRPRQAVTPMMRRFTVNFSNGIFEGHIGSSQLEYRADRNDVVTIELNELEDRLIGDPQIFRESQLSRSGRNIEAYMPWPANGFDSDEIFWRAAGGAFFVGPRCVPYRVGLVGRIRNGGVYARGGAMLCEVFLTNQTTKDDTISFGLPSPTLMDACISVQINNGAHVEMPRRLLPEDYRLNESAYVAAQGINCAAKMANGVIYSVTAPLIPLPLVETPDAATAGMKTSPTFEHLAKEPLTILDDLLLSTQRYQQTWVDAIVIRREEGNVAQAETMALDAEAYNAEIERLRIGVDLLRADKDLIRAFQLANETMRLAMAIQRKPIVQWRLFQLGFILSQLSAITERHQPSDPSDPSWDVVDVLKFDTGGGKTESILGVLLVSLFYARIKGRTYGSQGWMRFPLRLLSVQQFQRLSYVIAQGNLLREREQLGGHPFTIGYFTGMGTPNRISDGSSYSQATFLPRLNDDELNRFKFINNCPYCGSLQSIRMVKDVGCMRIKHVCSVPECPSNTALSGTEQGSIRGEIGIYVSDEEVYRYLPSVLVGTVDKIVIMGMNARFSRFWGTATHWCPDHGFSNRKCEHRRGVRNDEGQWETSACGNNSRSQNPTVRVAPMQDPGIAFCVQDEAHLLSESLGNFDAHYESLMRGLQVSHGGKPPKILAATATIREFENHVNHLYMRHPRRFPVVGAATGESFYTRIIHDAHGNPLVRRYYRAFLPIGIRTTQAGALLAEHYRNSVEQLIRDFEANPQSTAVRVGIEESLAIESIAYLKHFASLLLIYVNRKQEISEIMRIGDEIMNDDAFETERLDAETELEKVRQVIHRAESQPSDGSLKRIIATNMISHGVDIERLNAMVMVGWPARMAEYLQATARSGRTHPGLVMTVMNDRSLYELSTYNRFEDYHIFTERLVEAVPINRFAPNVLDRTLPGLVGAVILQWAAHQPWGDKITAATCQPLLKALVDDPARGQQLIDLLHRSLDPSQSPVSDTFSNQAPHDHSNDLRNRLEHVIRTLSSLDGAMAAGTLTDVLTRVLRHRPLTSLRDIESQVQVTPADENSRILLRALGQ